MPGFYNLLKFRYGKYLLNIFTQEIESAFTGTEKYLQKKWKMFILMYSCPDYLIVGTMKDVRIIIFCTRKTKTCL